MKFPEIRIPCTISPVQLTTEFAGAVVEKMLFKEAFKAFRDYMMKPWRRRFFVKQRLNQSINVTGIFSGHAEPNVTNSENLTTNDAEGKKHTNLKDKASSNRTNNLDSIIESVARRTNSISSVSQLPKPGLPNSGLYDKQTMRMELAEVMC
ncbi:hypothetical protein Ddc_19785 [Ditylenchus destructor]|nr:hypothetical protein Ddc_19785 [Ditylenchus destructor]